MWRRSSRWAGSISEQTASETQFVTRERKEIVPRKKCLGVLGKIFLRIRHRIRAVEGVWPAVAEPALNAFVAAARLRLFVGRLDIRIAKSLFQHALGISWVKYLQGYRIHRAAALLNEGRCNVTEAAMTVGFDSLSHFNLTFRSFMGVCPKDYGRPHERSD